jgi:hypothetical protein
MPVWIYPSSYLCDCGYRCDFFEKTIHEMTEMSLERRSEQALSADDGQHRVVFHNGQWVALICPVGGRHQAHRQETEDGAARGPGRSLEE